LAATISSICQVFWPPVGAKLNRILVKFASGWELHDSIGSTLGLVGMYADLVERHIDEPLELRRVSSVVRDAANEGEDDGAGLGADDGQGLGLTGMARAPRS